MRYGRIWGVAVAAAAIGLAGCGDEPAVEQPDLTVPVNEDMGVDMAETQDMTAVEPATAQITVADVVGIAYQPVGGGDGGVPIPAPVHSMAVVVDFPQMSGTNQHTNGTSALHGCSWNRYNVTPPSMGGTGPFPAPNENAGTVAITGYDTSYTLASDTAVPGLPAPVDPTINCKYNAMTFHFDCFYGTDSTHLVGRYIFVTTPYSLIPSPVPSPSPSPAPAAWNTDLFKSGYGDTMVDNAVREAFTPSPAPNTYTDARMTNLTGLPKKPHVIAVNGTAATTGELENLANKFDGSADLTIDFSCDPANDTKGGGCTLGGITGLLVQTSLGKKWEPASGLNVVRFGTMQCVDADDGAAAHSFTITQQMQQEILGTDMNQTVRVVLVRLKANSTTSGPHPFFETAGRGIFSFIDQ
jgi:hypothetical protein